MAGPKNISGRLPPGITPTLNQGEEAKAKQDQKDKLRSKVRGALRNKRVFRRLKRKKAKDFL